MRSPPVGIYKFSKCKFMIAQIVVKLKYSSAYQFTLNLVLINSHYWLLVYSQKIHHLEDVQC